MKKIDSFLDFLLKNNFLDIFILKSRIKFCQLDCLLLLPLPFSFSWEVLMLKGISRQHLICWCEILL